MKKIFNFGKKKGQSPSRPFIKVPSYFGVQTPYPTEGYQIQSKELGKIHKAALLGDVSKVQQLLLLGKSTVNDLDKMKRTPLHLACANGYPDVVSLLVERKCELNLLDNDNRTPLMKAIECRQEECATILLEHGADPNLRDENDDTILHYVASGRTKFMAEILIKYKIDIDAVNKEGLTPLLLATTTMNTELADFLLKNGANVNALDSYKRTALMIAVSVEALGLVTLLLQNNADYTLQDISGWTAETYAERYGYPLHIYHKQIEKQKEYIEQQREQFEKEKLCPPQIICSEKPSDTEFGLCAPSLDKKAEGSSAKDSVSSLSDKPGSDDHLSSTENELDFDMKCSHENLLEISAKRIVVSTNQNTKDSVSLGQHEDHPGRIPSAKPIQPLCEIKDTFTNQEVEGVKEIKPKLDFIEELDLSDTDDVDDLKQKLEYKGSSVRIQENFDKRDQEQRSHENLLEISARRVLVSANQNIKDSISLGQHEDLLSGMNGSRNFKMDKVTDTRSVSVSVDNMGHPRRNSNEKPIQPTLQMKDSFTNQEIGKRDASKWDSTSTSQIKENHKNSKDVKLKNDFPGKSLPLSQNQLPSTRFEKIPTIKGEAVVGIGPVIDYKVGVQLEKPVPQKEYSKDMKLQNDFPGKSLPLSQNQLLSTKVEKIPTIKGEAVVEIGPVIDYKVGVQLEKPISKECSKDMKLQSSNYPGKSLPLSQNQLPSTKVEKIPTIKGETVVGIGPVIDYKVGVQLEKPVPQKECSKDMKLQNDFPGKSLPLSQNQLPSTRFEKIPTIKGEAVVGIGPVIDYKVGVQLEKPVPQKECSKDMKLQNDFPGKSLPLSQNQLPFTRFEKIPTIKGEAVVGIGPVIDYKVEVKLEKPVPQECSKDVKLKSNYAGKSLPLSQNQLPSTKVEKIPTIKGEAVVGIGPVIDYKVGVQLEKPVPKECSKDMKLQSNYPGKSLPLSQNQLPSIKVEKIPTIKGEAIVGIGPVIDYKVGVQLEKPVPKECSKDMKLQSNYPGKSLPLSQNQLPSTKVEKIPTIKGEAVVGIGPVIGYKVGVQLEKPVPQKECSKDVKLQSDYPDKSLPLSQNGSASTKIEKIPSKEGEAVVGIEPIIDCKVGLQLEKPVPQDCSKHMKLQSDYPGKSLPLSQNQLPSPKSENIPSQEDENVAAGSDPIIDYKEGDHLEKSVPQKQCELFLDKEKWKEVKKDLKQELKFKGPSELSEASSALANNLSDSVEKEKNKDSLSVGHLQSFPGERVDSTENVFFQNLKINFPKNVFQFSSNMCSKRSTPQSKNKPKIERTCNVNEKNIGYVAKNIKTADSKLGINEINEDRSFGIEMTFSQRKNITNLESDSGGLLQSSNPGSHFGVQLTHSGDIASTNQEKIPELITSRKHKEKTKHTETSFQNSHHNATNSTNELRHGRHSLPHKDKISKMHLDKELKQDKQILTNELGMLQAESLTLEKEKIQPQKKMEEKRQKHQQNKMETLERKDGDKLTENKRAGKANEQFSMESHQHGKDEKNKIPEEEIPIMSISSEEKLTPVHHILKGNWREKLIQKHQRNCYFLGKFEEKEIKIGKNVKKSEDEKWISKDSSITSEKANSSSSNLFNSHDDSTLNETDPDELRLTKNILNEKNKDKVEMAADAFDDLTQSQDTGTEDYDLPPSNYVQSSPCLQEDQNTVLASDLSVKVKKSQWKKFPGKIKSLEKAIRELQKKFSERSKIESQLEHQKVECDRELYRDRLEDEKEKREKLQTEIDYPSCVSYATFDQEYQTSELNLQKEEEWLLLKDQLIDQIDILSIQLSKAEDEIYQLRDSLRRRTLILEETQRELKQTKDKAKELEHKNRIQKEKSNRSFLEEEPMKERITQIEREIQFLKKSFEDAPKKGVFEIVVLDGLQVQLRDCSMTVDADTEKQDHVEEEKNDECIHIREQIRIYKNEQAEEEDTIRKLKQEQEPKKKPKTSLNILSPYQKILEWKNKQLQKEVDQTKNELQEYQEQNKQKQQYINDLEDYIQKLKMEHATFEDSIKEQMGKTEKFQKNILDSTVIQDLKGQLEAESSKYIELELKYISLQEELFSKKMMEKKRIELGMKRQYEGAVNVKDNLELPEVEHGQGEQDELDFKQFLQTHRAEKDNFYEQMEQQLQELQAEISKMTFSHKKAKAALERHREQRQDSGIYRSLSNFFLSCLRSTPDQDFELWSDRTHQYLE